jgi:uncharacterized protein YhjY with autotransporter beta-barrel domain
VTTGPSQSISIDPTIGASGGPFTGVTIVTPPNPSTGTAVVNGLTIVFTPAVLFTGSTTFTFALSNQFSTSAPALITVTVRGRPDPSKDPDIDSLVTAMTDATERFIGGQIWNISDRLGTLNGGGPNDGTVGLTLNGLSLLSFSSGASLEQMIRAFGRSYDVPSGAPTGAAARNAAQRLGVWLDGTFGFGSHNGIPTRSGLNFGGTALTAGLDYRVSERLALGISGGWAHDQNDLITGHDQGTRENASDVALYGALRLGRSGFLDVLAGAGTLQIDTRRFDRINAVMMRGSRTGSDAFASVTAGERFDLGRFQLAPYGGFTGTSATLKAFTETGPGIGALAYGDQAIREVSGVVGVRGNARWLTLVGTVTPTFAVEYDRRLSATSIAPLWYADRPDTVFFIPANQIGAEALNLDIGATLRLPSGWLFSTDYRSIIDRTAVQHLLRLGLSTKL